MNSILRAAGALYQGHLLTFLRSRTAIYWTLAFPLFFLLMFGLAFGRGRPQDFDLLMPGLLTITIISSSLFGVSLRMVTERETGVLRRHRLAPVHALSIVLAHGAMAFTTLIASVAVQALVAKMLFGFRASGPLPSLAVVVALGGLALIPFGLVVGSVARDSKVAPAMTNFLFFPLMFLSGAAIPFSFFPEWLQRVGRLIPTTYLVEALRRIIIEGGSILTIGTPAVMMLLTSIIGISVNGLLFRWESNEPVRVKRLLLALVVLGVLYGAAYAVNPVLHMAQRPAS